MNEHSDIRLSGRLLAMATLICAGFAAATLIPVIQGLNSQRRAQETADPGSGLIAEGQFDEFEQVVDPVGVNTDNEAFSGELSSVDIVRGVSDDGELSGVIQQKAGARPNGRGVYVPVTVHPVTVTVDGSAFAEQLARVASGVDEMVTAQRDILQTRLVARTTDTNGGQGWNAPAPHESRLNEIDATLRQLTESVESLRSESHVAVDRLTEDLRQAENAADLLHEFRRTLAEHREILASAAQTTDSSAPRIAQHPGTDTDPVISDAVPTETEADFAPWVEPAESPELEPLEVPLPVEPRQRTPVVPLEPTETDSETSDDDEIDDNFFSSASPVGESESTDVAGALTPVSEERPLEPADDADFDVAHVLLPVPAEPLSQQEEAAEITDRTNDPSAPTHQYASLLPEPSLESRPVVFEQTVNFVLPPASDDPAAADDSRAAPPTQTASTSATARRHPSPPASALRIPRTAPRMLTGPIRQTSTRSAPPQPRAPQSPTTDHPTAQPAVPRRLPTRPLTPREAMMSSPQPASPYGPILPPGSRRPSGLLQRELADGVDAVRDFGNDLRDRTADMMGRTPRQATPPTARPSAQPSMLQRLGSAFRQAGRSRTVQ